ncbi:MAG: DUF2934 domain-containing protein [Hyphomicrobiales bacterium]|nr:DUF2934 domain-containing protein [Hyphomicrobiales bacterium]
MTAVTEEVVRSTAYRIWQDEGCPEGRAEEHWLKACAQLEKAGQPQKRKRVATARPKKAKN